MLVADTYLGHRDGDAIPETVEASAHATVVLSDTERQRSRVRTETTAGRDLGIVVARDLADGDVLEAEDGTFVVVELAEIEALVLDFADSDISPAAALELGHAVGNKHWNLAVRGQEALFPVTDSKERMEDTVADLLPGDVPMRYEHVPPTTFDDDGVDHTHGDGTGHEGSGHSHNGTSHAHDHGVRTIDGGDQ
ncbi:urease accessory protein UreE (plasmid) [Haloarcula marismortui ATCC 43049]|uniref:Urease accessory protein UreE n=2 Tax=Haloarcula marismortui TaxID=2238 RepID=F2Z603_HALMA|nr:urease accessory protein UreE [Haloarcula marismortui]AAV44839.1 urease accessory protein UreE [Haloarcula marismortui ATCC 43049]QCP90149.1 urease accessory protein UreE [Haloarcula marismortui ATCC 43049]BAC84962.1 urease accessory protein UreE [Haloarcula marismortui]